MKNPTKCVIYFLLFALTDASIIGTLVNVFSKYKQSISDGVKTVFGAGPQLQFVNDIEEETRLILDTIGAPEKSLDSLTNYKEFQGVLEKYDYIVVGSGAAGSTIASRLSENGQYTVLLLEAGKPADIISKVPLYAPLVYYTDATRRMFMEKQDNMCWGLQNQRMNWPRGYALGGTSNINYMIYTRGHPKDFDRWAAAGNPGWSYQEVLPYFLKSEMANNLTHIDLKYHNTSGLLSVSEGFQSPLARSFIEAGKQLGYSEVDYTSPNTFGFSTVKLTVLKGRRYDVATAFLFPFFNRKNLIIKTESLVIKILIDENTKTAIGVRYAQNGLIFTALANKEVIISAGAFFSPQLLMLSGIGPKKHLEELGIPVIQDLQVGQNLHDHLTYMGLPLLTNDIAPVETVDFVNPVTAIEFLTSGTGPWTSAGVEALAYIKTPVSDEKENYPDIEYMSTDTYLTLDEGLFIRQSWGFSDYHYTKYLSMLHNKPVFTIMPMLLHPKSIGWLKLSSTNPWESPKYYGNYYTDPERKDIRTMIESIRFIYKLISTPAFQKHGVKMHSLPVPGCESYVNNFDQYWECALRTFSVTLHHQVGTCKMGPSTDPTAVVDARLRVYGINRLRVADTSIIPFALSAHTNAPAIMIGEKAADMINQDRRV